MPDEVRHFGESIHNYHNLVCPCDSGKWVIKSVEIEVHAAKGICNGCSSPYRVCLGNLL